jgi:LacI family transcriptional regulator
MRDSSPVTERRGRGAPAGRIVGGARPVTLKDVARSLGLSPATVSLVLNRAPGANAIPTRTQERVFEAARRLDYRPNLLARSLRSQRTSSIGVLVPEINEGYTAGLMSGVENYLSRNRYFYLVASHRSRPDLLASYLRMFEDRMVEGFILSGAMLADSPVLPTVAVAARKKLPGVTNLLIDQDAAARAALAHLSELGHRRIAFFRGWPENVDAEDRWRAIGEQARLLGLELDEALTLKLTGRGYGAVFSPEEGYEEGYALGRELLERGRRFTALFAFNDISAIGAMRAFLDAGLGIPQDVSVVGFDDIQSAAFLNPSLTTVRQPLHAMGELAGRVLLQRLAGGEAPEEVIVEPELVVRGSSGPAAEP